MERGGSTSFPSSFNVQNHNAPQTFPRLHELLPNINNSPTNMLPSSSAATSTMNTAPPSDDEDTPHGKATNGGNGKTKSKRKKVNHACLYCRRSHMTCDEGRPCQRCIKREIGHLCHDDYKPISNRYRDKSPGAEASGSGSATPQVGLPTATPLQHQHQPPQQPLPPAVQSQQQQVPQQVPQQFPVNPPINYVMPTVPMQALQQPAQLPPSTTANWPLYPQSSLGGTMLEGFGNEFADLSSILDNLDDPVFWNQPSFGQYPYSSAPLAQPTSNTLQIPQQQQQQPVQVAQDLSPLDEDTQVISAPPSPGVSVLPTPSKTEKFFLAAADLPTGSRESRLNRVIHAKYEAGLLKPYNYATGYARLSRWMDRLSPKAKQQILQPLGVLRPKFREVAQSLTDMDLVLIEEAFERLLLDYDRVFSVMGVPACLWRRTGEIYKANREFAELVGVEGHMLRDGRLCIYELMAEESAVNYWQKFGQVAFDAEHKAVLTSCVLRFAPIVSAQGHVISHQQTQLQQQLQHQSQSQSHTHPQGSGAFATPLGLSLPATPHSAFAARRDVMGLGLGSVVGEVQRKEDRFIHCCCSFTIRRDDKGIPSVIVGNFIRY
ncbi:hypothetical protein BKA62DRAFT_724449 [Auriculariales sp. MPI-PUGE-AT-0066]|nr:hypothetical protein BKA62DRAFT_724449 [Auriculariales sp. MPI-PUGE-AT-0066]